MGKSDYLHKAHRVVVKVGTSVVTTETGRLDLPQLKNLVGQIAEMVKRGYQVLLVSSGAIAAGVEGLGLEKRPTAMPELQAAASIGQGLLLQQYTNLFKEHGLKVGQVLLTQYDTTHREQYLNARNTLSKLLELGAIPIINENDTTAVDEIRFGDNDTLAALVANLCKADLLIALSDTEGLFTGDPRKDRGVKLLETVEEITPEIEALGGGVGTKFGSGGMVTKIQAAKIVTFAQIGMIIAHGRRPDVLLDVMEGKSVGTFFVPRRKKIGSRKLWIAFGKTSRGTIFVDDGAREALTKRSKSLLPAGVFNCEGNFEVGDAVDIADQKGQIFAKGLTSFGTEELNQIKGLRRSEVVKRLSEETSEEVVHRDCLVILK
ncbi:MAG: glutamate 5-kinase [Actinomycetota bacterium]|nr:glutamate 5-kinase [Actinomycetota bacterium]